MAQPQRGVRRYAPLAIDDAGDAVDGYGDLAREFRRREADLFKFFRQMFSGVDGCARHGSSMIVDDFHVHGAG